MQGTSGTGGYGEQQPPRQSGFNGALPALQPPQYGPQQAQRKLQLQQAGFGAFIDPPASPWRGSGGLAWAQQAHGRQPPPLQQQHGNYTQSDAASDSCSHAAAAASGLAGPRWLVPTPSAPPAVPPVADPADEGKIIVWRLTQDITFENLWTHFGRFGDVEGVEFAWPISGLPSAFAFVTFADPDVVPDLLGRQHSIRGIQGGGGGGGGGVPVGPRAGVAAALPGVGGAFLSGEGGRAEWHEDRGGGAGRRANDEGAWGRSGAAGHRDGRGERVEERLSPPARQFPSPILGRSLGAVPRRRAPSPGGLHGPLAHATEARLRGELASTVARAAQLEAALALAQKAAEAAEDEAARLRGELEDVRTAVKAVRAEAGVAASRACPALPIDIWTEILNAVDTSRDAAMLACSFSAAKAAHARSKWPRAVRVKVIRIERCRAVLEPLADVFDVTVSPGEDVQAAVNRCPRGGCVLLLPGMHSGPLVLVADKEVHVFGRGRATLQSAGGHVVISMAAKATVDGVIIRRKAGGGDIDCGVWITGGALRLQDCDVASASDVGVFISGGNPVLTSCKVHDGADGGVLISGGGTKGCLENCDVWGNTRSNVEIGESADPLLTSCTIREGKSIGVFLSGTSTKGRLKNCKVWGNARANVLIREGADPLLASCRLLDGEGAGVQILDRGTKGRLEDCDIAGNARANAEIRDGADPFLMACTIRYGFGDGVQVFGAKGRLDNCNIACNASANVRIERGADPLLVACRIHDGESCGVLFYGERTKGRLEDCDIAGNAMSNVAIRTGADPLLVACKIRDGQTDGVLIHDAKGRLDDCDIAGNAQSNVEIGEGADPLLVECRVHTGKEAGVFVTGTGSMGRLEGCELWDNADCGVWVQDKGDATLVGCTLRDHAAGQAAGVYVSGSSCGKVTVGPDCSFARNAGGDVVRH